MGRKVVTRAPHREVGLVNPAWLLDHAVEHESHLERRFIISALACPVLVDIVHQPMTLTLPAVADAKPQTYTPDFKLRLRDGTVIIVEVKPQKFVAKHASMLLQAEQLVRAEGYRFLTVTDAHIDGNELAARSMLLMRYGRLQFGDADAKANLDLLRGACQGSASVHQLVSRGLSHDAIWNMVARHQCRVPADFSIDADQTITMTEIQEDCHDYFCEWFGIASR
jgi:hypothetical protein